VRLGEDGKKAVLGNHNFHRLGTVPTTYFPPSAAVTGQISSTVLMQLTYLFHCFTSELTLTNLVTLKIQAVHSSEMSVHLATTSCRNPNEGHLFKSNKKMKRNGNEKIW
jgi:hypothetical protein